MNEESPCWRFVKDNDNQGRCLRCGVGQFWHCVEAVNIYEATKNAIANWNMATIGNLDEDEE